VLATIESNINQGGGKASLNSEKTSVAFVCPPYGTPYLANPGLIILALSITPQLAMPSSLNVAWEFPFLTAIRSLAVEKGRATAASTAWAS
jgi:hypothetical protein